MADFDAVVVGGGMAGLSAGLWLARYRRTVCVFDDGQPRNDPTWAVHGYPGIPDPAPHELRRILIDQAKSAGAQWSGVTVAKIDGEKNAFAITTETGDTHSARRVILAYGRRDKVPDVPGMRQLYGISVFHCPDCDGPSNVDQRLAVYGWNRGSALHALYLLVWGREVTLLTDGHEPELKKKQIKVLEKYNIAINTNKIARLCDQDGRLSAVEFADGDALPLDTLFFHIGSHQASDLADQLGCKRGDEDSIHVDNAHQTSVPGVFAAGDLIGPPYLAISAAAKGVKTALAVHKSLLPPDQEL